MRYQPNELSGTTGNAWLLPLVGFAAAAVASFAYAWIDVYSPIGGYVSVLFVLGLAFGTALPLAYAGRLLKVRNGLVLRLNGAFAGLMAVYLSWVFFLWVFARQSGIDPAPTPVDLAQSPRAMWSLAELIAENGWYTIGSSLTPSGVVLWAFWLIEAAIVVAVGTIVATRFVDGRGFCEHCNRWLGQDPPVLVPADSGTLANRVRDEGLAGLTDVAPPSAGAERWVGIGRQRCASCGETALFCVDQISTVRTEKGRQTIKRSIVPWSVETPAETAEIDRIRELLSAADAARYAAVAKQPLA